MIRLIDAEGRVKDLRNAAHVFGAKHPFTFGTITLVAGLVIGLWWG